MPPNLIKKVSSEVFNLAIIIFGFAFLLHLCWPEIKGIIQDINEVIKVFWGG